ncbi:HigA family addiction module antitoxin [Desulfomarina profundi]|uniref:HigA family addiction module antitoxin n=1 Tax=Desulfomarina profundi TaxID=2772557 RepID=UPI0038B37459
MCYDWAHSSPALPGEIIKEDFLKAERVNGTKPARQLGISRVPLSRLLNDKTSISVDIALRLSQCLDTNPVVWLRIQDACDLWQAAADGRSYSYFVTKPSNNSKAFFLEAANQPIIPLNHQ